MYSDRAECVVDTLAERYGWPEIRRRNPFQSLVTTILSQNTTDVNAHRAAKRLFSRYATPREVAGAPEGEIDQLIRPAGLHKVKAPRIKEAARLIVEEYDGDLGRLLNKGLEEARGELMEIRGVGPKTADVVLLFAGDYAVFPVDTHVYRVSRRLLLAPKDASHEGVRKALMQCVPPEKRGPGHVLFLEFGRQVCRAQNPLHEECPFNSWCPWYRAEQEEMEWD